MNTAVNITDIIFKKHNLIETSYNDQRVRKFVIKFLKLVFNCDFKDNYHQFGVDLINKHGYHITIRVEVERGLWSGNLWEEYYYSFKSGLGFRTVNIPCRKLYMWYDLVDGKWVPNDNGHFFIRTNSDFTQVIIINAETIKDSEKVIFTKFKASNNNEIEYWMSFREENVFTYNLINGKWILQKKNK